MQTRIIPLIFILAFNCVCLLCEASDTLYTVMAKQVLYDTIRYDTSEFVIISEKQDTSYVAGAFYTYGKITPMEIHSCHMLSRARDTIYIPDLVVIHDTVTRECDTIYIVAPGNTDTIYIAITDSVIDAPIDTLPDIIFVNDYMERAHLDFCDFYAEGAVLRKMIPSPSGHAHVRYELAPFEDEWEFYAKTVRDAAMEWDYHRPLEGILSVLPDHDYHHLSYEDGVYLYRFSYLEHGVDQPKSLIIEIAISDDMRSGVLYSTSTFVGIHCVWDTRGRRISPASIKRNQIVIIYDGTSYKKVMKLS